MYQSKYLPTDGKIYQMDYYWDADGELYQATMSSDEYQYEGLQKVELCLCTRSIEVGDKVRVTKDGIHFFNDIVIEKRDNGYFMEDQDPTGSSGLFYYLNQTFKVLGPILKSDYIGEKELTDDEVRFHIHEWAAGTDMEYEYDVDEGVYLSKNTNPKYPAMCNKTIQIKCPTCKHYH